MGQPILLILIEKVGYICQAAIRELGFNSDPFHPMERAASIRTVKALSVQVRVKSSGVDAQAAAASLYALLNDLLINIK